MGSPALEGDREEGHRAEAGLGGRLDTGEPHGRSEVARALYLLINQSSDIGTWGGGVAMTQMALFIRNNSGEG